MHYNQIENCQQCDRYEDTCGLFVSIFFESDKCQEQQQPWYDALYVIERIKMIVYGLSFFGAEFVEVRRDYDL